MSFDLKLGLRRTLIWCARSEAGMRSSTIVMARPGFKRLSDVGFVEWNHKIETFSTCTADQALAKCIRLGDLYGVFSTVSPATSATDPSLENRYGHDHG